ncbi:hypothetical protein ETAA8_62690 [Anatilimnocola aggregata]|uniref:FeoB-associated Cys-rich membrane protein n=1 Tax=Anatilimnocola aggregata TaxID=2528021 RepID=A0A517YLL0_9BACT|nr:FeoB-associated Cys-rich membrane protein [Anatilimnocola aggregata]QDU31116.1 hypothetical protein ETAA8_62690 [Anatilimnocola aggregata]
MVEQFFTQNFVVALIVLTATLFLLYRARTYVLPGSKAGCATGCGSCPSNKSEPNSTAGLVQLGDRRTH